MKILFVKVGHFFVFKFEFIACKNTGLATVSTQYTIKLIRVSGDEISSKKVPKLGAPNQTVKFVHYLKEISDTQTCNASSLLTINSNLKKYLFCPVRANRIFSA